MSLVRCLAPFAVVSWASSTSTLAAQSPGHPQQPRVLPVQVVESPSSWIPLPLPGAAGVASAKEGPLYFRIVIRNPNRVSISVGISFQSYLPDGARYEGCYAPGGSGPGVSTEIAPYGRALLVCNRATVPRTVTHLQVTTRTWSVAPVSSTRSLVAVLEAGPIEGQHFEYGTDWDAYARLKPTTSRDADVRLFFRFLSADSVQVATCESDQLRVEPEVILKATCSSPAVLVNGMPRPVLVEAEVRR